MPQASDFSRDIMKKWFGGTGIEDGPPIDFLIARGWTLAKGGIITKPTPSHTVSEYEWRCVEFLCDEWDYGYEG